MGPLSARMRRVFVCICSCVCCALARANICPCVSPPAPTGPFRVHYKPKDGPDGGLNAVFDTVLFATGRTPCTAKLGLEAAGVNVNKQGKIPTFHEQTNVPHIYALGDVCYPVEGAAEGALELTPVAIQAGRLLSRSHGTANLCTSSGIM